MPFFGLAVFSLVCSAAAFFLAAQNGGVDGGVVIGDQVFTGTTLYATGALLLAASALFFVSALIRTVRRIATLLALLAIVSSGGIGLTSGTTFSDYITNHACASQKGEIADQCAKRL